MSGKIAEIIKRSRIVAPAELERAIEFSERDGVSLSGFLLRNNLVDEERLLKALSAGLGGMQVVFPDRISIDPAVIRTVPRDLALAHKVIPVNRLAGNLIVCTSDPTNLPNLDKLSAKLGVKLSLKLASEISIEKALAKYYLRQPDSPVGVISSAGGENSENYVVSYVDRLMYFAVQGKASDIHIEPFEKSLRIRLRVDGVLIEYKPRARFDMRDGLLARVKIMSGLDIAEKRLPQDGNCKIEVSGVGKIDFRVSTLPTQWGEKIVLRVLDKSNLQLDLTRLGFESNQLELFREAITRPFGMVLVTGPTGSGKTTTLYSALNELNRITDNVVTVEDPVEYTIPGIAQVNVRSDIGLSFASALKAFLRQDPDVIMVGEIRDGETADIAMRASLTGHIVLSTLHTNNAPETLERLRNLGVEPFTIISAVNCVVAQRLMRKLCQNCKELDPIPPAEQIRLGLPSQYAGKIEIFKERGCSACNHTGYSGRTAIYEVMPLSESLKRAVSEERDSLQLKRIALSEGLQSLRQSAWRRVAKGISSISELLSCSSADDDARSSSRRAS